MKHIYHLQVCIYGELVFNKHIHHSFICLFSASSFKIILMPFKDGVTAFAKLEPTDRVQHVVCEAKNEVRKVT